MTFSMFGHLCDAGGAELLLPDSFRCKVEENNKKDGQTIHSTFCWCLYLLGSSNPSDIRSSRDLR